jgi:predicted DNA-binding transcriptional regulator AlpA
MIEMIGSSYITEKEAARRYGYSKSWFEKKRMLNKGPRFIQLNFHGRVLYPLDETDKWFSERMMSRE